MSTFTLTVLTLLWFHQHWLFLICGEVYLSSESGEWVKSAPNVPAGDDWKSDF